LCTAAFHKEDILYNDISLVDYAPITAIDCARAASGRTAAAPMRVMKPDQVTQASDDYGATIAGQRRASQQSGPVHVRVGSNSTELAEATRPSMSAVPPIPTVNLLRRFL